MYLYLKTIYLTQLTNVNAVKCGSTNAKTIQNAK